MSHPQKYLQRRYDVEIRLPLIIQMEADAPDIQASLSHEMYLGLSEIEREMVLKALRTYIGLLNTEFLGEHTTIQFHGENDHYSETQHDGVSPEELQQRLTSTGGDTDAYAL